LKRIKKLEGYLGVKTYNGIRLNEIVIAGESICKILRDGKEDSAMLERYFRELSRRKNNKKI